MDRHRRPRADSRSRRVPGRASRAAPGGSFSPTRAIELCLFEPSARASLAALAARRREDLLIHLALTLFPGAPRYRTLARSIQMDLRAFFGSHTASLQEANALLFSVSKPDTVRAAVAGAVDAGLGGMRDAATFRFYAPALNRLPAALRVLVGCAGVLRGGVEGQISSISNWTAAASAFIACAGATDRLPLCTERTRVDLGRLKVSVDQPKGMLL